MCSEVSRPYNSQIPQPDITLSEEEEEDDGGTTDDLPPPIQHYKKWPVRLEAQMCGLWEEEENLYDTTMAEYRDKDHKRNSLQRIATVLNVEGKYKFPIHCKVFM